MTARHPPTAASRAAAAIRARRSERLVRHFGRYAVLYIARNFHGLRIARDGMPVLPQGRPAIVYTNHPSWWDPLVIIVLAGRLFADRPGFGPMDAAALGKYRFMERLGIFGIDPDTPAGAAAFLRSGIGLLADPRAMLWVTAEGHFSDPRRRPVTLRPGISRLATRMPETVLLPLALEYVFWDERYPEALARFGDPVEPVHDSCALHERLERRLAETMDRLADAATTRDPAQFRTIIDGNAGVGGIYDLWRRGRALIRGERFQPGHGGGG